MTAETEKIVVEEKKENDNDHVDKVDEVDEERIAKINKLKQLATLITSHLQVADLDLFEDNKLKQGLFISECRDKKLKNT